MATARRPVFVGTSGFSYPAWRGRFYPEKLPAKAMLRHYATVFGAVEINHTFRQWPSEKLLAGWAAETPEHFRFACKAPQGITHRRRLKDAAADAASFWERLAGLGHRRGPVLFQLPPNLKADVPRLTAFLDELPKDVEAAFEFRHESWFADATWDALRANRAALCIADADTLSTPAIATAGFGFLRLRRQDYTADNVDHWCRLVLETPGWERVFVFFKHEDEARGPVFAQQMITRLG